MDSIRVAADSDSGMTTKAFAGAKPGSGNDPGAKTSLDAAVSIGVLIKDVDAYFGSDSTAQTNGNVASSRQRQLSLNQQPRAKYQRQVQPLVPLWL